MRPAAKVNGSPRMTKPLWLIACLSLAACGGRPEQAAEAPTPAPAPQPAPAQPAAEPEAALFFVGRWAAKAQMCGDPWVITAARLQTPGEVSCTIEQVTKTRTGYAADAVCTAEGPPQPWRIRFAYAQSAQALLVENGPFEDVGLVRCP